MEASLSPLHHKTIKWQGNDKMKLTNNTIQKIRVDNAIKNDII